MGRTKASFISDQRGLNIHSVIFSYLLTSSPDEGTKMS